MFKKIFRVLTLALLPLTAHAQSFNIPNTASSPNWSGHHTFVMSPTVPDPVNPTDAVDKRYVDAKQGGVLPNPPAFSVQAAGDPLNPFTLTSDSSVQINKLYHQQIDKLPKSNVLHSDFGGGCANPADPTFDPTNPTASKDSTCAIQADINYVTSTPVNSSVPGCVYIPQGNYKISSALRITKNICIIGDSNGGTILTNVSPNNNLITIFNPQSVNTDGSIYDGTVISDLTLSGTGHTTKGTLLEADYAVNLVTFSLTLTNSGGRGMELNFSSERSRNYNMQISQVRWPLTQAGNANEDQWWGALIINPANTYDGYVFNENAPNGVYLGPNLGPISANTWVANTWVAGGFILTDGLGNNWQAQAPGTSGATVPAWASMPSDGQQIVDGSITWRNISHRTLIVPTNHTAIHLEGENNLFSGSVKSLQYISGISMCSENCTVMNSYFEGFVGSPNHSFLTVNFPEHFPGTGTLAGSGAQTTLGNLDWIVDFVNDPADANFGNGQNNNVYIIMPNDYDTQVSTPSADIPGINRNQFEVVRSKGVDGQGNWYIADRMVAGSTVPAGTSWPAGHWFAVRGIFNQQVGNGPMFKNDHFNTLDPPLAGYAYNCQDNKPTICAEALAGMVPDGQYVNGLQKPSNPLPSLLGNRLFSIDHSNTTGNFGIAEYLGAGILKVPMNASLDISSTPLIAQSFSSSLPLLTGARVGGFGLVYSVMWSPALAGNVELMNNSGTYMHNAGSGSGTTQVKNQLVQTAIGSGAFLSEQVNNGKCWYDSNTTVQPTFRFCFEGGPLLSPLISEEVWNGTAWVSGFSVTSDTTGNALLTSTNSWFQFQGSHPFIIDTATRFNNGTSTIAQSNAGYLIKSKSAFGTTGVNVLTVSSDDGVGLFEVNDLGAAFLHGVQLNAISIAGATPVSNNLVAWNSPTSIKDSGIPASSFTGMVRSCPGTLNTTGAASDAFACSFVTTSSRCSFNATNANGATLYSSAFYSVAAGTITLNHAVTPTGGSFTFMCSAN